MYEKYLLQFEEAGKIRNLKESSINGYKNNVSHFLKYHGKTPEEITCQDVRIFGLQKRMIPELENSVRAGKMKCGT